MTGELVMSTGMRARMAMMRMWMSRQKHCKPIMDQGIMYRTEGIVGLTWKPVMSMGMRARMLTTRMRRKKHFKPTMDQCRMWRPEGIVLESVKIEQYISDL
jgi:hypothetical protein